MTSPCPMKPILMDGTKPNSTVHTLGLSFPCGGLGREREEQDLLDSKAPTQTPPRHGPGAGEEEAEEAGWEGGIPGPG